MSRRSVHVHVDEVVVPAGIGTTRAADTFAQQVVAHVARRLEAAGHAAGALTTITYSPDDPAHTGTPLSSEGGHR